MADVSPPQFRALTDARDRLVVADEPLAGFHLRAGGELPGAIVSPALLALVRQARTSGRPMAHQVTACDDQVQVSAWVEASPVEGGQGCELTITRWHAEPLTEDGEGSDLARSTMLARHMADLSVLLGPGHEVLAVDCTSDDLADLAAQLRASRGKTWNTVIPFERYEDDGTLAWQLADNSPVRVEGSKRGWHLQIVPRGPLGLPGTASAGFELLLVPDRPNTPRSAMAVAGANRAPKTGIAQEVAPSLRRRIARVTANAETISAQLAGPLARDYVAYADDIAAAGEHLRDLVDDMLLREQVGEASAAIVAAPVDLAELARRAAAILAPRARERRIALDAPHADEDAPALGEERRVLQILLNLIGNAIAYSPEGSQVWVRAESDGGRATVTVADQGEGLDEQQQARVFEKFERLGRQGDGGSGLGLYVSRLMAEAMDGALTVESARGQGARFTLDLPARDTE